MILLQSTAGCCRKEHDKRQNKSLEKTSVLGQPLAADGIDMTVIPPRQTSERGRVYTVVSPILMKGGQITMKIWNAPKMEELDVRMTLTGAFDGYEESYSGYEQWFLDTNPGWNGKIPEWHGDAWTKEHNNRQAS